MLRAADAIAVIDEKLGRRSFCDMDQAAPFMTLRIQLGDRSYLSDILERYLKKYDLSFAGIVKVVIHAPEQEPHLRQPDRKGNA